MYNLYSFTISRLNNAEITAFFMNVQKAINEEDADTCGFDTTVWTNFRATLKKLVDQVYVSQGSEYTAKMKLFDDKRVAIFRRLRLRLQMVNYAEENTKLNAVKDVVEIDILSKYNADISQMAVQQKTAVLEGFCHDCKTKLTERQLEDLGMADDVDSLLAANASFMTAYSDRCLERSKNEQGVTATLRNELTELYERLAIEALYRANSNSTVEADVTKATACQALIGVINELLKDAKARLDQRQKKASENGNGNGNENPNPAGGNDQPAGNDNPGGDSNPDPSTPTSLGVTENADGSKTEKFSDGSYIVRFADGTYLTVDKNGEKVMHY